MKAYVGALHYSLYCGDRSVFFSLVHFSCSTCPKGHFTIRTFAYGSHCLYSTMELISFTKFTTQRRRRLFAVSQFPKEHVTPTDLHRLLFSFINQPAVPPRLLPCLHLPSSRKDETNGLRRALCLSGQHSHFIYRRDRIIRLGVDGDGCSLLNMGTKSLRRTAQS